MHVLCHVQDCALRSFFHQHYLLLSTLKITFPHHTNSLTIAEKMNWSDWSMWVYEKHASGP